MIRIEEVTKRYPGGHDALKGLSLEVEQGEMVFLTGHSGAGKSTLLRLIALIDRPTSGLVLIDGQDLGKVKDLDRFRARTVGFVFQMHNLIPTLNALENVEVPMMGQVRSRSKAYQAMADRAGLELGDYELGVAIAGGVAGRGGGIRRRSESNAPVSRSTTAAFIPEPPMSIPNTAMLVHRFR